jgi:AraC-like DNA-binding protein
MVTSPEIAAPPRRGGTSREPTISRYLVARIIDAAARCGVDPQRVISAAGLTRESLADPDQRIGESAYLEVWREAASGARTVAFPLQVAVLGSSTSEPDNVLRFICMAAPNVAEALARASRYLRLATDLSRWELSREGEYYSLAIVRVGPWRAVWAHADEFAAAEIVRLARVFTASNWSPASVHFAHPAAGYVEPYRAFFGAPVFFSAAKTELRITEHLLATPIVTADPAMTAFFERFAGERLAGILSDESGTARGRVSNAVLQRLHEGLPRMDRIASELGLSARTLRRQLEAEGTSYQRVVDDLRLEVARTHLERNSASVTEVGFLAGFSDVTAFHRAFRRWVGMTPAAYRAAHALGAIPKD